MARKSFRSGEASGFANKEISGGHVLVHFVGEADGDEARCSVRKCSGRAGDFLETLVDFFGFASDCHKLPGFLQSKQILNELFDRTDTVAASGEKNHRGGRI